MIFEGFTGLSLFKLCKLYFLLMTFLFCYSVGKGVGEPPEKKAKPTPPKPAAPAPNPASKIKIIPARPKRKSHIQFLSFLKLEFHFYGMRDAVRGMRQKSLISFLYDSFNPILTS
jgi:hypothetical protein